MNVVAGSEMTPSHSQRADIKNGPETVVEPVEYGSLILALTHLGLSQTVVRVSSGHPL